METLFKEAYDAMCRCVGSTNMVANGEIQLSEQEKNDVECLKAICKEFLESCAEIG